MATVNLLPTSDVYVNGWTPSSGSARYAMVDDPVGTPDDDGTYIYENLLIQPQARFGLQDTGLDSGNTIINSLTVHWRARWHSINNRNARCLIYVDGSLYVGPQVALTASYANYSTTWAVNPKTGVAWTAIEIDDLLAGLYAPLAVYAGGVITQLYVAVDYTLLVVEVSPNAGASTSLTIAPTVALTGISISPTALASAAASTAPTVFIGDPSVLVAPFPVSVAGGTTLGILSDGRWRVNTLAFFNGNHIVGDFKNGKLYKLKRGVYDEDGTEIIGTRISQTIRSNQNLITVNELQILTEPAVGLIGGQGEDPEIVLTWSTDGGATWGNALNIPIGKIGEYVNRAITPPLGQGRNWVFQMQITDPVRRRILGAFADVEEDPD